VLDEVMVWGCGVSTRLFSYCAEMTVRYHAPVRPLDPLRGVGELVENKRGRLFLAKGELFDSAGQLLASSTGKYMPVRDISFASLLQDFEGTPEQLEAFFGKPG
jgi:acyl-coenzyme A thioesterase PaaI-like protein